MKLEHLLDALRLVVCVVLSAVIVTNMRAPFDVISILLIVTLIWLNRRSARQELIKDIFPPKE